MKNSRARKLLKLLTDGQKWTTTQMAESLGCTLEEARNSIAVLRNSLAVKPGPRTDGHSYYVITDTGRERIRKAERQFQDLMERKVGMPPEELVQHAIRTQPSSVFNWGARA